MSEEIRFYRSQWGFPAEDEITSAEARSLRHFVRAYLIDGKVDHAETVKPPDEIELVVYYDQMPSDELHERHRARYGKTRFFVSLPHAREGEDTITDVYEYDVEGTMIDRVRSLIGSDEWPRREWRYDRAGALYEIVEYEYDSNGDVTVRSRAPDGTILHEDKPPFSD